MQYQAHVYIGWSYSGGKHMIFGVRQPGFVFWFQHLLVANLEYVA